MGQFLELGEEDGGPFDGTGDQLGEVGDKEGKIEEVCYRFPPPGGHIEGVTDGLESIEADADGKDDPEGSRIEIPPNIAGKVDEGFNPEVEVLEGTENAEVDEETEGNEPAAVPFRGGREPSGDAEVDEGGEQDKAQETPVPSTVEGITGEEEKRVSEPQMATDQGKARRHNHKKEKEL